MRPWVLRALVLTAVYGVAETLFVALRSWSPDLLRLWSVVLLVLVAAVVIVWVGAEVILDRRPPEWTWFGAALAAAPAAGLLSWILLALFVDRTSVADLQAALIGRASFTALLILASVVVGSRLGWLSLRRHGEGADDPVLDADDDAVARQAALDRAGLMPSSSPAGSPPAGSAVAAAARVVPRAGAPTGPSVAGVRTPARRAAERSPEPSLEPSPGRPPRRFARRSADAARGPEVAQRDRMPEAARLAGQRRASTVRPAGPAPAPPATPVSSPFGPPAASSPGSPGTTRDDDVPESLEPPVVAVLPPFPRPGEPHDPAMPAGGTASSTAPATGSGRGDDDAERPGDDRPRHFFGRRRSRS